MGQVITQVDAFTDPRFGGNPAVHVDGDRVKLGGQAVTVLRGELTGDVPPTPGGMHAG